VSLDDRSGKINRDSATTVADQVARDLAEEIRSGRIRPDSRLPSEAELAQQYGVARVTVRRAVAKLRDEGMLVTVHGRGTFTVPAK
jgi:DNA-binding GntR family transcriptional regulator